MPVLTITKAWSDGNALTEAMLDNIKNDVETWANTTKLDATNFQDGAVTETKIGTNAVTTIKIAASAVTTGKIADNAITGAKLATDIVDDASIEIATNIVQIKDEGVTTAKLADAGVTLGKRAALGQTLSSASGAYTNTGAVSDVTNLTTGTKTVTGRPVFVGIQSDGTSVAYIGLNDSGNAISVVEFLLLRDSTTIAHLDLQVTVGNGTSATLRIPPGCIWHIDTGATAGDHTWKLQALNLTATNVSVNDCQLVAYEIG